MGIKLLAPAKINLFLKVLNKRNDGYHNIISIIQMIDLYDEITLYEHENDEDIYVYSNNKDIPLNKDNLVYKSAIEIMKESHKKHGLSIIIDKNIPISAGLGGGSSDAATTLSGLNKLFNLGIEIDKIKEIGSRIGSDVPFFFGEPLSIVLGRGEKVFPLQLRTHFNKWVVLVNPNIKVSTKWVYENISTINNENSIPDYLKNILTNIENNYNISDFKGLFVSEKELVENLYNELEVITGSVHSEIIEIKKQLLAEGAEGSLMSGSGSTVFGLFNDKNKAINARENIQRGGINYNIIIGKTIN